MIFRSVFLLSLLISINTFCQKPPAESWRAAIHREDGNDIVFNFSIQSSAGKKVMYITNGLENIKVDRIRFTTDSVFIEMPVFESSFKAEVGKDAWEGVWVKGTSGNLQVLPFTAEKNKPRFAPTNGPAKYNMTGRWSVNFSSDHQTKPGSIAEFKQQGNKLSGTFLTATGDYRYQEGIVTGNKFMLSGFDGSHAFLFTGKLADNKTITEANYYSGVKYSENWTAVKDPKAKVSTDPAAMFLKPGEDRLNFIFPDLKGKPVSITDGRFKNKVVIIQLMGSWCPNCMDETEFLSDFYNKHKNLGIEMIALAYEYSTDFNRSVISLTKFQRRFNVQYPILITGVTVKDSMRTEKTLPQVTPIKVFPSSIILDKKGKVRFFETDFFGQGTGEHYLAFKNKFIATISELLKEP